MNPHRHRYAGSELELFQRAQNWKRYWASCVQPYLKGDVLEVGAGIGANTLLLHRTTIHKWVCLEPDETLTRSLQFPQCEVVAGTIDAIVAAPRFDTILYIDVLEHIEDDAAELDKAATRLRNGGNLIVLAPAHQWLYSPFDESIGHHRRYSKKTLTHATPTGLTLKRLQYLDSAGVLLLLANRTILRSPMPTHKQIQVWDRGLVPLSRALDGITRHALGKSILAVWERPA